MPTLKYFAAAGAPRLYCVHKPVTTIGKALGNDVAIAGRRRRRPPRADPLRRPRLRARGARPRRRHRHQRQAQAPRAPRPRRPRPRSARVELAFSHVLRRAPRTAARRRGRHGAPQPAGRAASELAGVRKLFAFSEKLINRRSVDELLEAHARRRDRAHQRRQGLPPPGRRGRGRRRPRRAARTARRRAARSRVRASRNVRREAITDAEGHDLRQHRAPGDRRRRGR